jgi:hypothetical protein
MGESLESWKTSKTNNSKEESGVMSDYKDAIINPLNNERCSTKPFCPNLTKIRGTYHRGVTRKEVDNGDEEDGSDYIFIRADECKSDLLEEVNKIMSEDLP